MSFYSVLEASRGFSSGEWGVEVDQSISISAIYLVGWCYPTQNSHKPSQDLYEACEGETYQFSGYQDPLVQTNTQTSCYFFLFSIILLCDRIWR